MITITVDKKRISTSSDFSDINTVLNTAFKNVFPNGWIDRGSFNDTVMGLDFGLIGDIKQLTNRTRSNDPMYHAFLIHKVGNGSYTLSLTSGGLNVLPESGKNLVMSRLKTGFRKLSGSSEKISSGFSAFLIRLKQIVADNKSNVYRRERYDDKFFA